MEADPVEHQSRETNSEAQCANLSSNHGPTHGLFEQSVYELFFFFFFGKISVIVQIKFVKTEKIKAISVNWPK